MSEGSPTEVSATSDTTSIDTPSNTQSAVRVAAEESTDDQAVSQDAKSSEGVAEPSVAESNTTTDGDGAQTVTNAEDTGTENAVVEKATDSQEAIEPEPDWLTVVERTEDNLMSLGNPNAPVTMIDYSDFL
ncbi:DsbA family protein [Chloroflexi bacterium TSY]|nr:DsbA family protein [Chloroflexi bacterium TSY]